MPIMDWSDYPKNLDPGELVTDLTDLAAFLGVDTLYVEAFAALAAQVQALPEGGDQLARGFPRETVALRTWQAYTPTPTAGELRDALAAVPDAPDDTPIELLPLILNRLTVSAMPDTTASITLQSRLDVGSPWRTNQWRVPAPALHVDPLLLQPGPPPATLAIRLVADEQGVPL